MNYIIFDLEWNQSYNGHPKGNAPAFEIIEVGAVKVDEKGNEIGRFHRYVAPRIYKRVHYKIKEVTGIDSKLLREEGEQFKTVYRDFISFCGSDYRFCTWGDMDLTELQNNCDYYRIRPGFGFPLFFYDLQKLFSLQYQDGKERINLKGAAELLGIESDENTHFHSAYVDALYTAEVFRHIDMDAFGRYVSVDYHVLPKTDDDEIYLNFGTYTKFISRPFADREGAMNDRIVTGCACCVCGRPLRKKIRWFSTNGKQYYSLCYCPDHGFVKGKIRVKKAPGGRVFIVKTQKLTDEEGAQSIRDKKNSAKK